MPPVLGQRGFPRVGLNSCGGLWRLRKNRIEFSHHQWSLSSPPPPLPQTHYHLRKEKDPSDILLKTPNTTPFQGTCQGGKWWTLYVFSSKIICILCLLSLSPQKGYTIIFFQLGLSDFTNKNTECPFKCEFQMNNR